MDLAPHSSPEPSPVLALGAIVDQTWGMPDPQDKKKFYLTDTAQRRTLVPLPQEMRGVYSEIPQGFEQI